MNFISLTVITCLDDYLFQTLYENPFSQLIKEGEATIAGKVCRLDQIIQIETTTSPFARFRTEGNRFVKNSEGSSSDDELDESKNERLTNLLINKQKTLRQGTNYQELLYSNVENEVERKKMKFSNDVPPKYIYIDFFRRSFSNQIFRGIYLAMRCFYVVFMFYFTPWTGIFLSYLVPAFYDSYWW